MANPKRDVSHPPADLLRYVRENWTEPSVTSMLTGQRFTSPTAYAAHLAEHGYELARAPDGSVYVRRLPPKPKAASAAPEKKTQKQQAIEIEARHAVASMRQRDKFRYPSAQLVADAVGVTRRTIERWRKSETYEIEVMAACIDRRIASRRRRRTD